jgi:poly(3-hydroxybutyrate) depolymerase
MNDEVVYLGLGGLRRRYVLHRPTHLAGTAPAVVMLDGRGGTPWTAMKSTGWSPKADAEGFLAVYPEALQLSKPELGLLAVYSVLLLNGATGS